MELMLLEQSVKEFVCTKTELTSNEKVRRIVKTLNFCTEIYNKHCEELSVEEAYNILYMEKE